MQRLHHALLAFAFTCLAGLNACGGGGGGGGGGGSPPPPLPAAPTITTQPSGLTVNAGASATFTVVATGSPTYQWQRNGQDISGATAASYTLNPASSANNGDSYTVVATNAGGSLTSAAAALRVTGVSVLAGQIGGEGYADGPAAQARFWGPSALALDSAGNLYVADYNAVRKITASGMVSTIIGDPRSCGELAGIGAAARLCYPYALAIDVANNLYVADNVLSIVWRIDANANMTSYSTAFGCIDSLAVSGPLLYVGDYCGTGGGSIKQLSTSVPGAPATFASLSGTVAGMSLDTFQNIYVASDTTIQKVSSAAAVSTLAGSGVPGGADGTGAAASFGCPIYQFGPNFLTGSGAVSISTVSSGTSYVADYCNHTIRAVTSTGVVTTFAGKAGEPGATDSADGAPRFFGPAAVLADPAGNVFVADYLNGSIRKITPAGVVTTYAGQTPHAGYADGAAAEAAFRYPYGVVTDAGGNLYVTDTYNFVIRKITPDGVVSTVAGTQGVPGVVNATGTAAKFGLPQGIAIDAAGNLYIADSLANQVRKVSQAGVVTTVAGPIVNGTTTLTAPNGVAVDSSGNVYVTSQAGVYEFNPAGTTMLQFAALRQASAIAIAPNGTVYVAAGSTINLSSGISTAGGVYTFTGGVLAPVATTTDFSARVDGILVGGDGNLYVSDVLNSVIRRVTPAGAVTVVAGAPALPIATAPGGLPAKINSPTGMALLSTGSSVSLAVVDSFEHSILRVDLP